MTSANGLPKIGRGQGNWEELKFLGFHQFPTRRVPLKVKFQPLETTGHINVNKIKHSQTFYVYISIIKKKPRMKIWDVKIPTPNFAWGNSLPALEEKHYSLVLDHRIKTVFDSKIWAQSVHFLWPVTLSIGLLLCWLILIKKLYFILS